MKRWITTLTVTATLGFAGLASAAIEHQGDWPADKRVSLDATHVTRAEAVTRLAKVAGWSVVIRGETDEHTMDVHVTDLPADKVLDVIVGEGHYVAKRDGMLITIDTAKADPVPTPPPIPTLTATATATPPPIPVPPPVPTVRGEDRVVHGSSLVIGADETVHDATVFGGSLQLRGTATGNVTVMGGSAHIVKGAHVYGSATTVGGSLEVEDGAQVDGDVGVVGGSLKRDKGAKIGGAVRRDAESIHLEGSGSRGILREVSDAVTRAAMLFVFGAVLFALMTGRMNALRVEAASRPMRSFALGIVGGFAGLLTIVIVGATIIGIPVAIVLLLGAVFATYAGICAVLATVGKALVGHKTDNPHIHLLVGCALFLVSGAIPFLGGLVTLGVVLIGMGIVVATRGAGVFAPQRPPFAGPYRTAETA